MKIRWVSKSNDHKKTNKAINAAIISELGAVGIHTDHVKIVHPKYDTLSSLSFFGLNKTILLINSKRTNIVTETSISQSSIGLMRHQAGIAIGSVLTAQSICLLKEKELFSFLFDIRSNMFILSQLETDLSLLENAFLLLKDEKLIRSKPDIRVQGTIFFSSRNNIEVVSTKLYKPPRELTCKYSLEMFFLLGQGLKKLGCSSKTIINDYDTPFIGTESYFKTKGIYTLEDLLKLFKK